MSWFEHLAVCLRAADLASKGQYESALALMKTI